MVILKGKHNIFHIALALGAAHRLAHRLNRRQQQRYQNANDRDHDQQFYKRKGGPTKRRTGSGTDLLSPRD